MTDAPTIYEERLVAFVDILGWTQECQSESPRLLEATRIIHDYANNFNPRLKATLKGTPGLPLALVEEHNAIEFAAFSDNFAVSMPVTSGRQMFSILSWACHRLLLCGFLTRGAITVGKLHQMENVIFGPALSETVRLEREEAIYPRLLCSSELMRQPFVAQANEKTILRDHLGRWIANMFSFGPTSILLTNELHKARQMVEENTRQYMKTSEKIAEKWRYMGDVLPMMLKPFESA